MSTLIQEPELSSPIEIKSGAVRLTELALVLAVAFVGPIFRSLVAFFGPAQIGGYSSNSALAYAICSELTALGVLLYVLFRQGRRWQSLFGDWKAKDILTAGGLLLYYIFAATLLYLIIQKTAFSITGHYLIPRDVKAMLGLKLSPLAVVFVFINPIFEELIVRGYLMTEIMDIGGSKLLAVVVSVGLQTTYHLYQGGLNASIVGACFFIMSVYYAKTRRIAPIILLHFGMDATAVVLGR
jgi:membrane protease YdiL (CAAX protease family)